MTRLRVGDMFAVPTGDGRAGVGQVVATYGKSALFFAIFERVFETTDVATNVRRALASRVLFLCLSMDAKVHAGHWVLIGRENVDETISLPAYKEAVGAVDRIFAVDYSGDRRRPATKLEAELLPNRKVVAPVRVERALRASLGLEPWIDAFDELRADGKITTADIFG